MLCWKPCGQTTQTKMTMADKTKSLESFIRDGWLAASPPGQYAIGVRRLRASRVTFQLALLGRKTRRALAMLLSTDIR